MATSTAGRVGLIVLACVVGAVAIVFRFKTDAARRRRLQAGDPKLLRRRRRMLMLWWLWLPLGIGLVVYAIVSRSDLLTYGGPFILGCGLIVWGVAGCHAQFTGQLR